MKSLKQTCLNYCFGLKQKIVTNAVTTNIAANANVLVSFVHSDGFVRRFAAYCWVYSASGILLTKREKGFATRCCSIKDYELVLSCVGRHPGE